MVDGKSPESVAYDWERIDLESFRSQMDLFGCVVWDAVGEWQSDRSGEEFTLLLCEHDLAVIDLA